MVGMGLIGAINSTTADMASSISTFTLAAPCAITSGVNIALRDNSRSPHEESKGNTACSIPEWNSN